jgi:hypothetical protein
MTNTNWRKRLLVGAVIATVLAALVFLFATAIPNASSNITTDDQTLEAKALQWARIYGLQGTPIAKRTARMTLRQWMALQGVELTQGAIQLGMNPDMPVFVLAIRGDVVGQQSPLPGQTTPERYDNIIVAIGASNGDLITVRTARDPSAMPIQVPLNVLTPSAPIRIGTTQPPMTPPTLAPQATLTPTPMQSVLPTPTSR